ncbi:hypothetical protein Y032_0639g981 [Ancylostoma ceylanicum]|uniref:PDZ domain-containing protein n=1 Tax=Ancylostoma ceylanicum TaxID=53326 RepID=A0A016WJ01_9BILA|nr:hypothetical protein Y032_0639g981 [Ancylostoma ceylanicum]
MGTPGKPDNCQKIQIRHCGNDFTVYVANIMPDSIAAMSLLIGECIVDVEGELVTSIPQLTTSMIKAMDKNGQARLLVEAPANDMLRNVLRAKIAAAVGPSDVKDLPLPSETRPWVEKGLAALKEKDPKSVYRPPKTTKSQVRAKSSNSGSTQKKRSTHFSEKTVEHSYYEDLQTSLIVKALVGFDSSTNDDGTNGGSIPVTPGPSRARFFTRREGQNRGMSLLQKLLKTTSQYNEVRI